MLPSSLWQEWNMPIEISYNIEFLAYFHEVRELKIQQLFVFQQQRVLPSWSKEIQKSWACGIAFQKHFLCEEGSKLLRVWGI